MCDRIDVSVIIINWNRVDDVLRTVAYLRFQDGVRFEVLVIDNGSSDGSPERLSQLSDVQFVGLESNVGPCAARNIAISRARGRYLFFLDSDAILSKQKLAQLVARMEEDPTIGVLACRIVNGSTRQLEQWIHSLPAADFQHREFETYSFSTAGALVRADALRDAGPFWDQLFIYAEEVDLSIRILRAGFRIVYYPHVRVYHCPSIRGRAAAGEYLRFQIRNWIWIFYRYYPFIPCVLKIMLYINIYIIKSLYAGCVKDCCRGIKEGISRTEIIDRFPDKLTWRQVRQIGALNNRTSIRLGRS